jgi:competence protein ComEC
VPLLLALAAAHVGGIWLGDRFALPSAVALWAGCQLCAGLALTRRRRSRAALALVLALSAGATAIATPREQAARVRLAAPREAVVEAHVARVRAAASGAQVVLESVRPTAAADPPLPQRLLLHGEPGVAAAPWRAGSWVRVALRVTPVRSRTNPGGRDRRRALARRGVAAEAREVDPMLRVDLTGAQPSAALAERRRRAAARLLREGRGGALLAALGLGEPGGLGPELRRALARVGLSHLVAVSGLHLWLVAGPLYLAAASLLRRSAWLAARRDTRRGALCVAVAGAVAYAVISGWAVPVQRALAFLGLLAAAQLARRRLAPSALFGAAGLAITAGDPAAPFAAGLQLSFAATAALVWSAPGPASPRGLLAAATAGGVTALRSSASATAATAPLVALHFGTLSPLGWLANGVAVPLTSLAGLPLALAAGALAAAAPESEARLVTVALQGAAHCADTALAGVVWLAERVPARSGVSPGPLGLTLSVAAALVCVRARGTLLRLALALCAAAAPGLGPPPALRVAAPRAVFLDVGQGDATLVQGRCASLLVDGGVAIPGRFDAGERVVVPALGALGVRRLDLVVASHADLDHAGGLRAVLEAVPADRLWLPPGGRRDPAFAALVRTAQRRGVVIEERAAPDPPLWIGDLRVETLAPRRGAAAHSRNDASLVLRVRSAGRAVLLPGDLEQAGEHALLARGVELRAELLKLGHHGSRTSSSAAFLAAVSPTLAIVSAPRHGRFGMPHREVRERLAAAGIAWRWTGRDGAVLVGLAEPSPGAEEDAASEP